MQNLFCKIKRKRKIISLGGFLSIQHKGECIKLPLVIYNLVNNKLCQIYWVLSQLQKKWQSNYTHTKTSTLKTTRIWRNFMKFIKRILKNDPYSWVTIHQSRLESFDQFKKNRARFFRVSSQNKVQQKRKLASALILRKNYSNIGLTLINVSLLCTIWANLNSRIRFWAVKSRHFHYLLAPLLRFDKKSTSTRTNTSQLLGRADKCNTLSWK